MPEEMMPSDTFEELDAQRSKVIEEYKAAKAAGETAKMQKLNALAVEIHDMELELVNIQAAEAISRLNAIRGKVDALTGKALAWPFGDALAPESHERLFKAFLPEQASASTGANAGQPPAEPSSSGTAPTVAPGAAQDYLQLWNTMEIRLDWQNQATAIAKKIVQNQARYAAAVAGTPVPWWFVAVVHCMECSMRFDQHLHNGDPLSGRTTHVPPGRPPSGSPPFTWETSARDAVFYEHLDRVSNWSLQNVLFNWHRYNGIENEYKRRNIPTPYLWSGSQHYRKGKYVADRVFDANAVSAQVGAAVILKTLVDIKAVTLDAQNAVVSNPATAAGHVGVLDITLTGQAFAHVANELNFPGALSAGSTNEAAVRRLQEWLDIHKCVTPIDGTFGDSTTEQLKAFQAKNGRPTTGVLDEETWVLLTNPMRKALVPIDKAQTMSLEDLVVAIAKQHLDQNPIEIGGNNRGPWVRLYMAGRHGEEQLWCAGFVCFIVAQAAHNLGVPTPFPRQVSVPAMVTDAQGSGRLVKEANLGSSLERRSKLKPGHIFVVRDGAGNYQHTGLLLAVKDTTFDTIEGNTGGEGGIDGPNARQLNRAYRNMDFIHLV